MPDKRATGLDKILNKLLRMTTGIIAPSLTTIFSKSILTRIYPNEWKTAKLIPTGGFLVYTSGFRALNHSYFFLGDILQADVEIVGGNDDPFITGNPGLFIVWIKPGSEAHHWLKPGYKITKVSHSQSCCQSHRSLDQRLGREPAQIRKWPYLIGC